MLSFRRRTIAALLQGGLGNQLFIYAAVKEQATRLGLNAELVSGELPHGGYQLTGIAEDTPLRLLHSRSIRLILKAAQVQKRIPAIDPISSLFVERAFHYQARIEHSRPGQLLIGYFQSHRYFPTVGPLIRRSIQRLKSSNPEYLRMNEEFLNYPDWIAIHLRRGDYLSHASQRHHGVASPVYFHNAVAQLRARGIGGPIWVSSDSPREALEFLKIPRARIIDPEAKLSPLESLALLSRAPGLVMSNSSFSWWAAWAADRPDFVVAPLPWFRDGNVSEVDLMLPSWGRLPIRESG